MTTAELKAHTANTLMNRPDLAGSVATALDFALLSLQRDVLTDEKGVSIYPEWPCMAHRLEVADAITFPAGSKYILLTVFDANIIRLTDVWTVTDSVETPLIPASDQQINRINRTEYTEFANTTVPAGVYHPRWYVKGEQFRLLFPPGATSDAVSLTAEMYRRLTLPADGSTNWFLTNIPDVLANLAAYYAFVWVGEDDAAAKCKALGEQGAVRAYKLFKRASQGGQANSFRPPLAQGRRY